VYLIICFDTHLGDCIGVCFVLFDDEVSILMTETVTMTVTMKVIVKDTIIGIVEG
jgi:hypothetical protein